MLTAALGGLALGLAFQPVGWWPLLVFALPALTLAVGGVAPRRSFGLGYAFGLAMLGVSISWVHVLGSWVAVLLVVFEAVFFGLLGLGLSLVTQLRWWPLWSACCWVAVEFAYSHIPFGGFGWTRIAYAAVDTPLAGFLPILGVAGVSFVVALIGQLAAWLIRPHRPVGAPVRFSPIRAPASILAIAVVVVLVGLGAGLRLYQPEAERPGDSVKIGIIQGNIPGRGIEALGRARSVTNNHLAETIDLMTRVRLGELGQPDFLLWPENSTDLDPRLDTATKSTVEAAVNVANRPILVGAVLAGPGDDERQTAALWWDPARGILATYAKRNLVPFGEWIPYRNQLKPLFPILDQVGAQSVPGTKPGVLDVSAGGHPIKVGDVICFELAYDETVHDVVKGGAQVLMVQSNNATYGGTGQIEQQFAITRARAMELRREIAVATTNSVSGFIDRNGNVVQRTAEFTAAGMVVEMPLRTALTPAVTIGPWLERGLAAVALICCIIAGLSRRRRRVGKDGSATGDQDNPSSVAPSAPMVQESESAR